MLYDSCCLLRYTQQNGSEVIEYFPKEYSFIQRKKPFLACSFPETQSGNSIYSFSISSYLCFAWTFIHDNVLHSIVIISHHNFASHYLKLLKVARSQLIIETPEEKYHAILDELNKWSLNPKTNILTITFFGSKSTRLLNEHDSFFLQFDPSIYFSTFEQMKEIWLSLLTNRGVLIIGDTAEKVSSAVFAAISILAPIKYTEPFLIYTRLGDNRFSDMIIGSLEYKLVGTTNFLAKERCKHYETIIILPKTLRPSRPKLRNSINRMTSLLLKNIESRLDRKLNYDPFFDILQKKLDDNDINKIVRGTGMTSKDIINFQKTNLFKEWRKTVQTRVKFRECFLSNGIELNFKDRNLTELEILKRILTKLLKLYHFDVHMKSVINRQISLIDQAIPSDIE